MGYNYNDMACFMLNFTIIFQLIQFRFSRSVSEQYRHDWFQSNNIMKLFVRTCAGSAVHPVILFLLTIFQFLLFTTDSFGISASELRHFEKSIIDYRQHLNPLFKKTKRNCTRYIIVHTSECDLKTTLKIVSKGKQDNYKWVSRGGHTHYVIYGNGHTYRILDNKFRANHAGLSMWNGETDINRSSVGIEIVGYHNREITVSQYKSVRLLIDILKDIYHLDNSAVLTHSQVAYAKPNQQIPVNHRGRKHCARNFDRIRAGLGFTWPYDPDVKAGRLMPETELAAIFYGNKLQPEQKPISRVIDHNSTIWAIAGKKYDSPNTFYRLPNGWIISGNRIDSRIGWDRIPTGTKIFLY